MQQAQLKSFESEYTTADRILDRIIPVFDDEQPSTTESMLVIIQLLAFAWAPVCPNCRNHLMQVLREHLPDIATEAAALADSEPPACHTPTSH